MIEKVSSWWRRSATNYHTCYETPDLTRTLQGIEQVGLRLMTLSERTPAVLFGGRHVSFYKVFGWGIIELLERN